MIAILTAALLILSLALQAASTGAPVLPAYASDNYVPLLPGEIRAIEVECPSGETADDLEIALTGWNTQTVTVPVTQ